MKRTSNEIRQIFEAKNCTVIVKDHGTSWRAGGEIFIYSPGVTPDSEEGFEFIEADFKGFDGTGYDSRGRTYKVWLVKAGEYVPATEAEFYNSAEDKRIKFGNESRSCSNERWYVHRDELALSGLSDMAGAFEALGL